MKLSIIIPVYNEAKTLLPLLNRIKKVDLKGIEKEIILVDDFSTDGSRDLVKKSKYKKILLEKNKGKGAALKAGIRASTGNYVIFQDADLEYDPEDYLKLLQPLIKGKAKACFGTRFVNQKFVVFGKNKTIHSTHWIGNKLLTLAFNLLYGTRLTDVEPCYKVFDSHLLKSIEVRSNGFEYDIELMCKLVKKGDKIKQLPISYTPRKFNEGKKINWKDGIIALLTMIRYRF